MRLALHKTSKAYYALKIMKKAEVRHLTSQLLLFCHLVAADNSQEASCPHQKRSEDPQKSFPPIPRKHVCVGNLLHLFCLRAHFHFRQGFHQDSKRLYLLLEYVCGGELFSHMRNEIRYKISKHASLVRFTPFLQAFRRRSSVLRCSTHPCPWVSTLEVYCF